MCVDLSWAEFFINRKINKRNNKNRNEYVGIRYIGRQLDFLASSADARKIGGQIRKKQKKIKLAGRQKLWSPQGRKKKEIA